MYGFSTGLTSIASPYACIDQRVVPPTKRQLNAEVLSAAIDASSLPRYSETGRSRRIGKRAFQSFRKTVTSPGASRCATTIRPTRGLPSKPQ